MTFLQNLLLLFIPLLAFSVLPVPGYIKDTIYSTRLVLVFALVGVAGLALFALNNRNRSLAQAIRWPPHWKGWGLALPAYLLWLLVSAQFSSMPGYSWLGHPYTQFGTLLLVACFGLAGLYRAVPVVPAIRLLALCTAVMAFLTLLEGLGFKPLAQVVHSPNMVYPAATVGHRPHLGGWFAIMALAPAYFYRRRPLDGWFWLWLISSLVGLGLCTTTSASIGVGVGILLWVAVATLKRHPARRAAWAGLALFAFSVLALPDVTRSLGQALGQVPPTLKDYQSTGSFRPRLYMWKSAWNAALERPLTGWGTDTFGYQVFEHLSDADAEALFRAELGFGPEYTLEHKGITYYAYKPKAKNKKDRDAQTGSLLYIRPHNLIFDELYSNGFIGLILFSLTLVALFWFIRRRNTEDFTYFTFAFLPYFIYLLAWFYVVSVTPLAFILIGIMLADLNGRGGEHESSTGFHVD